MTRDESMLERIEGILPQLQPSQLEMVLAFTEFVRERVLPLSEDEALWSFVQHEQAYRTTHPEDVIVYHSDEDLLAALDALS